jgi:hypothetical protein
LEELKLHLSSPIVFSQPNEEEELFIYLRAADFAINAVLI